MKEKRRVGGVAKRSGHTEPREKEDRRRGEGREMVPLNGKEEVREWEK